MTDLDAALGLVHWRLLALEAESDWIADASTLFETVEASTGAQAAWTVVLASLLQDPRFGSY